MRAVNLLPAGATRGRRWGAVGGDARRVLRPPRSLPPSRCSGSARRSSTRARSPTSRRRSPASSRRLPSPRRRPRRSGGRANAQARRVAVAGGHVEADHVGAGPPRPLARAAGERLAPESPGAVADPDGRDAVDGFDLDDDVDRPTPTAFVVNGFTSSQKGVARVIDRLSVLPWLSDVSLQQSTRGRHGRKPAVQFTIGANLSSIGGK